ncbi:serine/threonine-protein kinase, conidia-enriched transcript [Histoplasma ohiense]|nr:serine/threonine-protein kinase, conidia-enriched transcript [Histoplasma ohiense (nom. inval.)]
MALRSMEIVQSNEAFKKIDGKLQFVYVQIIARQDNVLYSAKWMDRENDPQDLSQLLDIQRVETQDRGPEVRQTWTVVSQFDFYVKTPSLFAYTGRSDLEKQILREVEACEVLRKHPHPNIAFYYGCQVTHGRVSGLCFKWYKVNPQNLNKFAFLSSGRPLVDDFIKASQPNRYPAGHSAPALAWACS